MVQSPFDVESLVSCGIYILGVGKKGYIKVGRHPLSAAFHQSLYHLPHRNVSPAPYRPKADASSSLTLYLSSFSMTAGALISRVFKNSKPSPP